MSQAHEEVGAGGSESSSGEWNEEGINELSSIATETLGDERQRGRNLDTKTASLAGATGVILSLNATLGRPLLAADVGRTGVWVERVSFLAAVLLLVAAMLAAVFGVLRPQKYAVVRRGQIRAFTLPASLAMSKTEVQLAMLQTVAEILDEERKRERSEGDGDEMVSDAARPRPHGGVRTGLYTCDLEVSSPLDR